MPELHRNPTDKQLHFAAKPLLSIDPQRIAAYKARYRGIEQVFNAKIRAAFESGRANDPRARFSTAESRAVEAEKSRKLEQLHDEFRAMLDPRLFSELKRVWDEFAATSPYKTASAAQEIGSYAMTGVSLGTGAVAMGLQVGATGLMLSNPFTAALAILNEADKWIGRAIGWVQMAKKQWDADCSRISMRVANAIKEAKSDSSLDTARNGGMFSTGAKDSTLTRQRLEKLLYHKVLKIREEMIKYKIRECEVTAEAQKLLEQKRGIEAQVAAIDKQLKEQKNQLASLPPNAHVIVASQKVAVRAQHAALEAKVNKLKADCHTLSDKIVALLNEVADNCQRLINKPQAECDQLVAEAVRSFAITEIKGKFAGTHTSGSVRGAIRQAF